MNTKQARTTYEKLETTIQTQLIIGDWSDDGHGKYEKITYNVNYPVSRIRQAYKDSCALTGVQFNQNDNYTGADKNYLCNQIMTKYEDSYVHEDETKILREFNVFDDKWLNKHSIDRRNDIICPGDASDLADLIMRFISLSMPEDFKYEEIKFNCEPINGYWNDELNVQFGYGLYI